MLLRQIVQGAVLFGLSGFSISGWTASAYKLEIISSNQNLPNQLFLNNQGQVAGAWPVLDSSGQIKGKHAFLWQNGKSTDLGALGEDSNGSSESVALALSDNGIVSGYSIAYDAAGKSQGQHPFLGNSMRDIGAANEIGATVAINDKALVYRTEDNGLEHDYLVLDSKQNGSTWQFLQGNYPLTGKIDGGSQGELLLSQKLSTTSFGLFSAGTNESLPIVPLSPDGKVVGSVIQFDVQNSLKVRRAAVWTMPDSISTLALPEQLNNWGEPLYTHATLINSKGQIAGTLRNNFKGQQAFLWSKGKMQPIYGDPKATQIHSFDYYRIYPMALNANGVVGGYTTEFENQGDGQYVFYFQESTGFKTMPLLGYCNNPYFNKGTFGGMNDLGYIVGSSTRGMRAGDKLSQRCSIPGSHAFIYNLNSNTLQDLNALLPANSGWELTNAHAINNQGQILVSGNLGYALLSPIPTNDTASCDANQDGTIDISDLKIIYASLNRVNPAYDVTGDGFVSIRDIRKCVIKMHTKAV